MRERPATSSIPDAPGSYQFIDDGGRVLYVGKAKSLRSRLSSYLTDPAYLPPKTAQLVAVADRVEWIQVANEVEAVMLEYALIKQHRPRFNIRLVDDKSYPWLAVTVEDEWPRATVVRGRRRPNIRYFGPFAHAYALRDTLDLLLRTFPMRSCSDSKFKRHIALGKPCLLYHIERCSGPCIGEVDPQTYSSYAANVMAFFAGNTDDVESQLRAQMEQASESLDFERAARIRDQLATLAMACERQQVVTDDREDIDVVGIAEDPLEASVCVFKVRKGRVVGRRAFIVDKVEDLTPPALVGRVLEELYGDVEPPGQWPVLDTGKLNAAREAKKALVGGRDTVGWTWGAGDPDVMAASQAVASVAPDVPRQILVHELPEEEGTYEAFLASKRGGSVALRVPRRGGKRNLLETVARNAEEELTRHRLRRASDHDSRARALEALCVELGLSNAPLRIECFDMSHLHGTDYVGSMVVFEDGLARKSEYRRFKVKEVPSNDDYAAMEEVLRRRLTALLQSQRADDRTTDHAGEVVTDTGSRHSRKFAYPPQLILLDGGKGQLNVGVKVLRELGIEDLPIAALAKTFEEVYLPGCSEPLRIPRGSEALFLLQRLRDEAHRFAITYHRNLRAKRMTKSVLEGVPGLGTGRRTRLLREMGSLRAVRDASLQELQAISWLPDSVASAVFSHLHPHGPRPS